MAKITTFDERELASALTVTVHVEIKRSWRVSMREEISHPDAAVFAEVFWMAIGESLNVEDAFDRALQRCPPVVAEFAELHL